MKRINPVVKIADLVGEPYKRGDAYASNDAGISELLGLTQLGAAYTEVPPGKSACPFHVHRVEDEMFIILEGEGEYRFGVDSFQVHSGDVLGAPCGGKEYAHKLTNTGKGPLKYLAISSKADADVCEYPDSDKFMVRQGQDFRFVGRVSDEIDYWDGEL